MSLKSLLRQVLEIKGVSSAAVVSGEGVVVESVAGDGGDLSFVGGLIASTLASSRALAGLLGDGEVTQTMVEYRDGPVLLTPLPVGDRDHVAVLTLDSTSSLGRVRFQLRRLLPGLAEALR